MRYMTEYRDAGLVKELAALIRAKAERLGDRKICIMEVCGSHTMAIARYGLKDLLPANVELVSGPGCPVCVTSRSYIDAALALAERGVTILTFGDMVHVPGTARSLAAARAAGRRVVSLYSPLDALEYGAEESVFLAIGFETTAPTILLLLEELVRRGMERVRLLTAFKLLPPALLALAADKDLAVDAFLLPGHVSAIIGAKAYEGFVREYRRPCSIAGFEPADILAGIDDLLGQLVAGEARVSNQYQRVVTGSGNLKAQKLLDKYLMPADSYWRGVGVIPSSGSVLRPEYRGWDAREYYGLGGEKAEEAGVCRCGEIIKGKLRPRECPLFGKGCTPEKPVGPCMVSSEGSCAASYRYGG